MSLADLIADVGILKNEAKLSRDSGDVEGAIDTLREAVEMIRSDWELPADGKITDLDRKAAWQLADCLGVLGGNYRRRQQFGEAVRCFEDGKQYEQDPRLRLASSYNTVNAIVAQIEGGRDATSQIDAIGRAVETLEQQIFDAEMAESSRRMDRWAWADLGQCLLLQGKWTGERDAQGVAGARDAYDEFVRLSDAKYIQSSLAVLQSLQGALEARNDANVARTVMMGIDHLRSALQA